MNPDVVRAVDDLSSRGLLPPETSTYLRRIAAGELVSVRRELEVLLYAGVALAVAGVGLLVRERFDDIGPLAIAIAIGAAAAGCLLWCGRRAPSKDLAFEYVLTLGALLAAADLAFVEVQFTALGENWPWHLALVAAFYAILALRFDSRAVFGLALGAFAAWRGVSLQRVATWDATPDLAVEAVFCGTLFVVLGQVLERVRWKAAFEPVAYWVGAPLLLAALAVRMTQSPGRTLTAVLLVSAGAFLSWWAWDERRVPRYALGVAGAGVGVCGLAWRGLDSIHADDEISWLVVTAVAAAVVVVVIRAQRKLRETR